MSIRPIQRANHFFFIIKFIKTMKKSFIIAAFAALTFIACNNSNKSEENHEHNADGSHPTTGTHAHDDGSVHDDHEVEAKQEAFEVGQDSTKVENKSEEEHGHDHSDSDHKH